MIAFQRGPAIIDRKTTCIDLRGDSRALERFVGPWVSSLTTIHTALFVDGSARGRGTTAKAKCEIIVALPRTIQFIPFLSMRTVAPSHDQIVISAVDYRRLETPGG
jgi:hypothetical protein